MFNEKVGARSLLALCAPFAKEDGTLATGLAPLLLPDELAGEQLRLLMTTGASEAAPVAAGAR